MLKSKRILVTGGTGSFGKAFVDHLITNSEAEEILIYSRDELKQFEMQQEFKETEYGFRVKSTPEPAGIVFPNI